jgi:hypothetical protein
VKVRSQAVLFPEYLDDWIADDNPVRIIEVFIDELDLKGLHVLAYNLKRVMQMMGVGPLVAAIRAA